MLIYLFFSAAFCEFLYKMDVYSVLAPFVGYTHGQNPLMQCSNSFGILWKLTRILACVLIRVHCRGKSWFKQQIHRKKNKKRRKIINAFLPGSVEQCHKNALYQAVKLTQRHKPDLEHGGSSWAISMGPAATAVESCSGGRAALWLALRLASPGASSSMKLHLGSSMSPGVGSSAFRCLHRSRDLLPMAMFTEVHRHWMLCQAKSTSSCTLDYQWAACNDFTGCVWPMAGCLTPLLYTTI